METKTNRPTVTLERICYGNSCYGTMQQPTMRYPSFGFGPRGLRASMYRMLARIEEMSVSEDWGIHGNINSDETAFTIHIETRGLKAEVDRGMDVLRFALAAHVRDQIRMVARGGCLNDEKH